MLKIIIFYYVLILSSFHILNYIIQTLPVNVIKNYLSNFYINLFNLFFNLKFKSTVFKIIHLK